MEYSGESVTHLEFLVRVEQQNICRLDLVDISVSLKLLSHFCSEGRDGEVEGVHVLDFWCLEFPGYQPVILSFSWTGGLVGKDVRLATSPDRTLGLAIWHRPNWRLGKVLAVRGAGGSKEVYRIESSGPGRSG